MPNEPAAESGPDLSMGFKTRLGVIMFFIYAAIYAGFVAINVVKPVLMEQRVLFGLNLAVFYGMGLIVIALVMALIYNKMCCKREAQVATANDETETK